MTLTIGKWVKVKWLVWDKGHCRVNNLAYKNRCCCKKPLYYKQILLPLKYIEKVNFALYKIHKVGRCDLVQELVRAIHPRCLQTTFGLCKSYHLDLCHQSLRKDGRTEGQKDGRMDAGQRVIA